MVAVASAAAESSSKSGGPPFLWRIVRYLVNVPSCQSSCPSRYLST